MAGIRITSGLPTSTSAGAKRGVLRAWATPAEVKAIPDLADIGYEYGKGQSQAAATDMKISNVAAEQALKASQFDQALSIARRSLDKARSANTLASILGLGGLAVTGLQGLNQDVAMTKRDAMQASILDSLRQARTDQTQSLEAIRAKQDAEFKDALANRRALGINIGVPSYTGT